MTLPELNARVRDFARPDNRRAVLQVITTIPPYVATWYLAYRALAISYLLTIAIDVVVAGFMLRTWLLQHDCGHGSFSTSQRWNDILGSICGLITLLPYHHWRRIHAIHHANHGDLDRRGPGYITTLTVGEYRALSRRRQWLYRMYRNPWIVLLPGALHYFVLQHRFAYGAEPSWRAERRGVWLTNLGLAGLVVGVGLTVGFGAFALVHIPVVVVASTVGSWIFLNQHSYTQTYWSRHEDWDYVRAAVDGSSYYKLPGIVNWFTADVGFHHVHHLNPRVPNYRLAACHDGVEELREVPVLTVRESFRTAKMALWDEEGERMVTFREAALLDTPPADRVNLGAPWIV